MRTTVEISQALLQRVRRHMHRRRKTLRALIEEGLERVLAEDDVERGVRLRDASFRGRSGFAPGVSAEDLPRFLDALNEPKLQR